MWSAAIESEPQKAIRRKENCTMKKQLCFLTASLFLLLLSACGGEPAGTWTPVESFQFT